MLSMRCQNSQKSENTQTLGVNSTFFQKSVRNMIHHYTCQAFMILLLFTVPYYHFLFLRYLVLAEHRFSSDILVPFPDLSNLYSSVRRHVYFPISQQLISVKNKLLWCFMQTSQFTSCVIRLWLLRTLFLRKTGLRVRWLV